MKNNFTAQNINLISAYEHNLLIHVDDFLYPIMGYKCLGDLHDELTVEISTLCKTRPYEVELIDPDPATGEPRVFKTNEYIPLLGEYISRNQTNGPRVILYINTIRKAQPQQTELLIAEVYVHEMMHAYFDTATGHIYEEKVEEPITEFAMLKFFEAFDQGANCLKVLSSALGHVQAKQNCSGIKCYGFGYYLFTQMSSTPWRELLYHAKVFDSQSLKEYSTPFRQGTYPFNSEVRTAQKLFAIFIAANMGQISHIIAPTGIDDDESKLYEICDAIAQHSMDETQRINNTSLWAFILASLYNNHYFQGRANKPAFTKFINAANAIVSKYNFPKCPAKSTLSDMFAYGNPATDVWIPDNIRDCIQNAINNN